MGMALDGIRESQATRPRDPDEPLPSAAIKKDARRPDDAPWAKDFSAITAAATTPIFITTAAAAAPAPIENSAARARVASVVHPERTFSDLKSLTAEILRLKKETQAKHEPDTSACLKMRICMLQSQWVGLATAAGIAKPSARLDPFAVKPDEVARAFMWSEAGGVVPFGELAADGGKAFQSGIRDAMTLQVRGFDALLELHRGQPADEKRLLQRELKRLGDPGVESANDTVQSLSARRQEILSGRKSEEIQKNLAESTARSKQLYIGLDGFVGTGDSVARYERSEALKAAVSDTTLGSVLATYFGGGDVEKMRALGQLGSNVEGLGGGAGVAVQAGRRAAERSPGTPVANKKGASPGTEPGATGRGPAAAPKTMMPGPTAGANVARSSSLPGAVGATAASRVEPFSSVGARLRTTPLLPRYVGEDAPGNAVWPGQTVSYCRTQTERARFKLEVREVGIAGKREKRLFDAQGRLFDTRNATTWSGDSKAIFVMNADGEIFASTYQKAGVFHHSTLAGGQPVSAAGELSVIDGKLVEISNRSGHYQPNAMFTNQALGTLRNAGVSLSGVTVTEHNATGPKSQVLR